MSDHEKKLEMLKKREQVKNIQIVGSAEGFIDILEATIEELKSSIGVGVEIKNLDSLLEQLESIQAFQAEVKDLKTAISKINLPNTVSIEGLDDLVKATESLSKQKPQEVKQISADVFKGVIKSIVDLTLKVEDLAVQPKQGQAPEDYIPMRRVMLVGKRLLYDDSFYTGGGGGGAGGSVTQGTSPWVISEVATSTGGYTPGKLVSAASTNATVIKGSPGTIGYLTASNINAAPRYLKIYNKATAPTVGTDVPVHTFIIPGNTAGAGTNIPIPGEGINLSVGISFALTTEATDAGSTGVALSEIIVNYGYA